ncbi:MAG: hypothetical protein HY742_05995 [Deltaproteobacteria bacterium]|nr:hypothetical protein [Deltaproteobacteria bacterium]
MNRENILATIADLKAELSNIEATKQQIESSLNGLINLLKLLSVNKRSAAKRLAEPKSHKVDLPTVGIVGVEGGGILASDRVRAVLDNIQGRFTRSELYKAATNDGGGPIAPGTFANIFSKLIKRKHIILVGGAPGLRDSVYMKTNEANMLPEPSPITREGN